MFDCPFKFFDTSRAEGPNSEVQEFSSSNKIQKMVFKKVTLKSQHSTLNNADTNSNTQLTDFSSGESCPDFSNSVKDHPNDSLLDHSNDSIVDHPLDVHPAHPLDCLEDEIYPI